MQPRPSLWHSVRRRFPPPGSHPRVWAAFVLPWVLVASGFAATFASTSLEVGTIGSLTYVGSVAANETVTVPFNATGYSYVDFAFQERPSCSLRAYALDDVSAERYTTSSILPDPETSLNCDRQRGVFEFLVVLIVFDNPFQGPSLNYSLRADVFLVRQPLALWAIPGFAAFLAGAVALAVRWLRSGVAGIVDELGEDKPTPYWEDEKR